jgi:hypothetical protein
MLPIKTLWLLLYGCGCDINNTKPTRNDNLPLLIMPPCIPSQTRSRLSHSSTHFYLQAGQIVVDYLLQGALSVMHEPVYTIVAHQDATPG